MKLINTILVMGSALFFANSLYAGEEVTPGVKPIVRKAGDTKFTNIDLKAELYDVYDKPEKQDIKWHEMTCDYEPAENAGNWHNFFDEGPRAQKASSLMLAVSGLTQEEADKIVSADAYEDYLQKKPKNWNEFKVQINRIESGLHLDGLYYKLISEEEYGNWNRMSLGYNDPDIAHTTCNIVERNGSIWATVKAKHKLQDLPLSIDVQFEGGTLLNDEVETITAKHLRNARNQDVVEFEFTNTYNDYSVHPGGTANVYILHAEKRKAVAPNPGDFPVSLTKDGGHLSLNISDNRYQELHGLSPDYKVNVTYTLYVKSGKFCPSDKKVFSSSATLTDGKGSIDLNKAASDNGKQLEAGKSFTVKEISFQRVNTAYFSGDSGQTQAGPMNN